MSIDIFASCAEKVAKLEQVQDAIHYETLRGAMRARQNLAEHHELHHAEVTYDLDGVDGEVILSDDRGLGVAMSIEYGRTQETTNPRGPSNPTLILHDAFALPVKERKRIREKKYQTRRARRLKRRRRQ